MRRILLIALLLCPVPLSAQVLKHNVKPANGSDRYTGLSAVALNGAAGTRTFNIVECAGYSDIIFWLEYTHANNGALKISCDWSHDDGTTLYEPMVDGTLASGVFTASAHEQAIQSAALTGDAKLAGRLGLLGVYDLTCVASHTGTPNGSDLLTVKYSCVTQ